MKKKNKHCSFKRHFRIYLKNNHPDIKKAGRTQIHQSNDCATITSGTTIKTKTTKEGK